MSSQILSLSMSTAPTHEQAPSLSHETSTHLLSENAQLKDEQEQMCHMLLDIAYHANTPRQQRGEILLFLSLFGSGRAATAKRQRRMEAQSQSRDALSRIAAVRDEAENLAHLTL